MREKFPAAGCSAAGSFVWITAVILSGEEKSIHDDKVACAAPHNKQVKNLMTSKVFVFIVKEWQLQRVDDAAHSVDDSSGKEPSECCGRHVVEDLCESQDTGPAHPNIKDR